MIMRELPVRKNIRLRNYDYSQMGYYFVTICVKNGHEMLGKVVGSGFNARSSKEITQPSVELTDLGIEIQKSINYICDNSKGVEVPKYVIMPNHVHLIVALNTGGEKLNSVGHGSPTLQSVIGRMKSYTAKQFSEICSEKYQTFWQPRFHDHIIRSEEEYQRIWKYIDENPQNWANDEYFVKD